LLSAIGAQAAVRLREGSDGRTMSRGHILLVEDEFLISDMISDVLIEDGFEVYAVGTAEAALRHIVAGKRVDLLLTDINLPGDFDGATLALRARELRPWLPVIYASANRPGTFRTVPGAAFVAKPYCPERVCALARQFIVAPAPRRRAAETLLIAGA
jgi:CheY-like chemotaxis protein